MHHRAVPAVASPSRLSMDGSTRRWARPLAVDFSRPLPAALLAIIYLGSHLPWLSLGYGADPDAWRVAISARYLLAHGAYLPSRLPGYPVHDFAVVPLLWGGWLLTNAASLAVSLLGVWLFARIVAHLRPAMPALLTLTFAFLPLLWSVSTATLDYTWALSFFLGSYLAILQRRHRLAGVLLGLAAGCRISYLAMLLPLALLLWRERQPRRLLSFGGVTLATWLLVFSPVWLRYGVQFWNFYDVRPSWGDFLRGLTEQSIGLLPIAVLGVALLCSWRRLRAIPALLRADAQFNTWVLVSLLSFFIYVRLPLQTYYLIPATPFLLLLLARILRPSLLVVVCLALVAAGFVDVYTTSTDGWRSPSAILHLRPTRGVVLQDYALRRDRLTFVKGLRGIRLPEHSVFTTGYYYPMLAELYHDELQVSLPETYLFQVGPLSDSARSRDARDVVYVWLLTQGDARDLIRRGYAIYTIDFARDTHSPLATRIYLPENERFGIH